MLDDLAKKLCNKDIRLGYKAGRHNGIQTKKTCHKTLQIGNLLRDNTHTVYIDNNR